nr:retrovirus-related Pol polyprotein from transposon TNT 1-94 [Ipomoea batatas]GMC97572.1 retrovirus-related Pol polyprotein from transposon TNT 1-94 [Ipomoea batatas]
MVSELGLNTENGEGDIKKTEPLKRVVSPYELNSNDNPGNVITQVRLRGDENYDEWARAMKTSLRARRKWGFVEGTILEPKPESIEYEDWWTVQSMLVSWIRNTVEPELRSTISHMEEEKLHQFLMGLDEITYGTVRSNILAAEPLPSLNKAYGIVIRDEKVKSMARVIGYPDWWGDRPRGEGKSGGRGKVTQRAYVGRGKGGGVRANAMHTSANSLAALNACKGGLNETMTGKDDMWIIDTGASNYMTGNVNILHNVSNMTGCPVGLPDGRSTVATKKGLVNLDERLKMHNVLYVPELNCNLISVSQLIDDSNCIAQFTKDLCVIQDRTSRMLIGAGERRNGLYYFRKIPSIRVSKVDSGGSLELWHKFLGDPSLKVTKLVPVVDISDGNNLLHKRPISFE